MSPNRFAVLLIFLLLASPAWLSAQGTPPTLVLTEPVAELEFNDQIVLVGRSEAKAESRVVAEVSGRVMSIDAREGRWISAGQSLVSIDPRRLELALDAKTAESKQAFADAELARKDLQRVEDLFDQEILPQRVLDDATATATRTLERFNQLEAERRRLELDLQNCQIVAPYAGFTGLQLVQVGEWVNPGTPVFEMVDLSVAKVTVDLPERHFGQVAIGSPVSIVVSGDETRTITGKVTGIAPQASEATHTFPVIVSVPNREGRLGAGMLVQATLSLKRRFSSLAVSKDAIVRQGLQTMVYTIVDGKAKPVNVTLSSSNGTLVAVSGDGLSVGMPVIVRGNERIFPGSPVRTTEGTPAPESGDGAPVTSQGSR